MSIGAPLVGVAAVQGTAATTINVPYPTSGLTSSHILVLGITVNSGSTTAATIPAGWTQVDKRTSTTNTLPPFQFLAIKQATGSETGNLTVTVGANAKAWGQILAFDGVNLTTPQDVTATVVDQTSAGIATITIPGVTPTRTGCALVYLASHNNGGETATPPSGFTETGDNTGVGGWAGTMGYQIYNSTSATGNVVVTFSGSNRGLGVLMVLRNKEVGLDANLTESAGLSIAGGSLLRVRNLDADRTATATLAAALAHTANFDAALAVTATLSGGLIGAAILGADLAAIADIAADFGIVHSGRDKLIRVRAGTDADWDDAGDYADLGNTARDIRERELIANTTRGGTLSVGTADTEASGSDHAADLPYTALHGPGTVRAISASYTVAPGDWVIVADGFSSATLTFPDPALSPGRWVLVKNNDNTANLVLSTTVGKGFDKSGSSTINLAAGHGVILVAHENGSTWLKFAM